ncbi:MAG: VanZ family protein [Bradymonadia bacterium]
MKRAWGVTALVVGAWLSLNAAAFMTQWTPSAADKALHAIAFFAIALFAVRAALHGAAPEARPFVLLSAVAACVALGAVDEWVQGGSSSRVSDITDLFADGVGALLGAGAGWLSVRRRSA